MNTIQTKLQDEFKLEAWQTESIINLIDDGNTIPFIARYRKEKTGNLDDQLLRRFEMNLKSLRAIMQRREEVLRLIEAQGKLDDGIRRRLAAAATLTEIEDLYRPYRPKRKTRGQIARNLGLEPLAKAIFSAETTPDYCHKLAAKLAGQEELLTDAAAALSGAEDILAEDLSDDAALRLKLRSLFLREGQILCKGSKEKDEKAAIYADYMDYEEPVSRIRGHRVLAINRGEREGYLKVKIEIDAKQALAVILKSFPKNSYGLRETHVRIAEDAYKRLIAPSLATEIRRGLTEHAEDGAMEVFAANLRSLLMQPPIQNHTVMAIDPGYRTGCKWAIVDATGQVQATGVIYPTPPQNKLAAAADIVLKQIKRYGVTLFAIGNGTASRETERFITDLIKKESLSIAYLMVNEAGASVYSASPEAAAEFPDFDVSLRSAVSIARRVQDPLAELVKIEPRSIGVGQYQHDMNPKKLDTVLRGVVEACVNEVGVDLNTASAALLTYVAGLSATVAQNVVSHREKEGPFCSRQRLRQVPRMGPKAFEQSAGFLRIPQAKEPLDNTFIHPESYAKVYELGRLLQCPPSPKLAEKAESMPLSKLAAELAIGEPTLQDILLALSRPGRDPRDDLPSPVLRSDVLELSDLRTDMQLRGTVRNVADFGAFVDIGVHQDGLVHISELADRFVRRPMDVVHVGQEVKVRVLAVDPKRKRISLSMKGIDQPN